MEIGQILRPQGIRGEVKVKPLTDDPSRFRMLKTVYIDGKQMRLASVRISNADVFIKFIGVDDRNAAELLRDKFIAIDRAVAAPLDDDEYYIADLSGATLMVRDGDGAVEVGVITRIESFGAADVFTVEQRDGKAFSFAFVKALKPIFDFDKKTLTVDKAKLDEVAVYED